ncbi:amidohydrolase [Nocardiopsis sp. EMB25]|uniref:M20 metallopeptidase family protein n=1 Tax=Nocardiopsis sp. EMB25 TaxID=2835867 RepID=UPI0022833217|nr:amidohydrolase [Nocardiopsis sp. EMB25]MCY9786280.1 amidohydrolase [Nocardiopsis sp. EMB25]
MSRTIADVESLWEAVDRHTAAIGSKLVGWRHHLHAHPELPNRERDTAAFVTRHLCSLGLNEVRTGVGGYGVVGVLEGGLPSDRVVALRADIDALPVKEDSGVDFASTVVDDDYPDGPFPVAHACGHDCHTAMLMGAAEILSDLRSELPGTILFVFQPAEEGPPMGEDGGARAMVASPALLDPAPTMVFGLHVVPLPTGVVGYHVGNLLAASCAVRITVHGQQVHGSMPWLGVDPMPPAAEIVSACGQIYRQVPATSPVAVSIGHVEDTGRFNIIGDSVVLWGTVRCLDAADMDTVRDRLRRAAQHIALAHGCTAEVEYLQSVPPVRNTPAWTSATLPTLRRVVGEEMVKRTESTLGCDDVSELVGAFGGLFVLLGCQDTEYVGGALHAIPGQRGAATNHNPAFYADDSVLATGTRLHANVAIDHVTGRIDPALVGQPGPPAF